MKIWDVTVVGEIYIDHVMSGFETWPKPGEEVASDHYTREIGGGCQKRVVGPQAQHEGARRAERCRRRRARRV